MRLKITHVPGCYALVVAEEFGTIGKDHVIQTAFYMWDDAAEKAEKFEQLVAFGNGVTEGFNLARRALQSASFSSTVEEIVAPEVAR